MNPNINQPSEKDEEIGIVSVVDDALYSMKFGDRDNEYDRIFDWLNQADSVHDFFEKHEKYLNEPSWNKVPNIESATRQVLNEAYELESSLLKYAENAQKGKVPDLDDFFEYIGGKEFGDVYEYVPVKAYGKGRPAFLRLYAIKLAPNKYVITGGGIKLHDSIQSSPGLKEYVLKDIRRAREWLLNTKILY